MACEDVSILVMGAGCADANGLYTLIGNYCDFPMWQQSTGKQFYIWRNSSQSQWRLGLKDDYYYVNSSVDLFQGDWERNDGRCSNPSAKDPPPRVTTPMREKLQLWLELNRFNFNKVEDSAGTPDFPFPFLIYDTVASAKSERHLRIKCGDAVNVEFSTFEPNLNAYEISFKAADPHTGAVDKDTHFSKSFHWVDPSRAFELKEHEVRVEGGVICAVFDIAVVKKRVVRARMPQDVSSKSSAALSTSDLSDEWELPFEGPGSSEPAKHEELYTDSDADSACYSGVWESMASKLIQRRKMKRFITDHCKVIVFTIARRKQIDSGTTPILERYWKLLSECPRYPSTRLSVE